MAQTLTEKKPDFSGYATKAGLECADGLTILKDAFAGQDGAQVPLVWQHGHKDPANVLGHAILEKRDDGMYAHCYFNGSPSAKNAEYAVQHEDITQMSIYANRLAKKASAVVHGVIREVSLVMAGANPGAVIDYVSFRHSDGEVETFDDEAIIKTGLSLEHADKDDEDPKDDPEGAEKTVEEIYESLTDEQKNVVEQMLVTVAEAASHSDTDPDDEDEDSQDSEDDAEQDQQEDLNHNEPEGSAMTHNAFDKAADQGKSNQSYELTHDDMGAVFQKAKSLGSLRDAVKDFESKAVLQHGIENIDIMFPDAKSVTNSPEWITRRTEWVARVLSGTRHTPFSRIKSLSADLTIEQARAKGFIKGSFKKEQFFEVAKRVTGPQTIYKKQKLDRDDILDITDFDVVAWIKGEMRIMLDEEIARAVLMGDGRSNADDDKIIETNIRPIATDHELYQTTVNINLGATADHEQLVDAILMNRRHYRGSGNPDFFTTEVVIATMLNIKDGMGRRIYANLNDLAATLRVASIIPVEVMEEQPDLLGIMVNLKDYTIGADRGGDVALFDDFDIDYNAYKYLIETRCSGALTKPKSALVFRRTAADATRVIPVAPTWNDADKEITIPDVTGLVYKNQATGAILDPEVPVTLAEGQTYTVVAVPTSNAYYIESTADDAFTFNYEDGFVNGPH